jgi:ankyrin repeat protein
MLEKKSNRELFYYDLIKNDDLDGLKKSFEENMDLCNVEVYGKSLVINAVLLDKSNILQFLISIRCDINKGDVDRGVTPLHAAALKNNLKMAKLLLTSGAEVDKEDRRGNTPLIEAVFVCQEDISMAALLLEHGADAFCRNKAGVSPYELAKTTNKKDIIKLFENKDS